MNAKSVQTLSSHIRKELFSVAVILTTGLLAVAFFGIPPGAPSPDTIINDEYTVYIPWTATKDGWTTPFVIANKGSSNASVTISYNNADDGSNAGIFSLNIPANSSRPVFREWTTIGTDGSAIVFSDQPLTGMVDMFNQNISGAYEIEPSGSYNMCSPCETYLPWTANARGWNTPFVVMNRGTANATVNITYYKIDGSSAGNDSVIIEPMASSFVRRDQACVECEGPARIYSDQPISVMVEIFRGSETSDRFASYIPAPASNQLFVPWAATTQGWRTFMKIVNTGDTSAAVNISYYDTASGMIVGNDSVTIVAKGVTTVYREKSAANGTDGSAVLNSDKPISVVVMQFSDNDSLFGAYTPAVKASNKLVIPWTATTQGWTSPYVISNTGSAEASVNINYYNTENGLNVGNISLTIPPGSSRFAFREWNTSNTDGSAVVSSDQPVTALVYGINTIGNLVGAYTPIG